MKRFYGLSENSPVLESAHRERENQLGALVEKIIPSSLLYAKRFVDIVASFFFLLSLSWLYLLIALIIFFSSGAPVFYSQPRVGRGGRIFRFYKFRSMVSDSDMVLARHLDENEEARIQWENYQKLDKDPRITRIGMFIRRTSLDELPQFWNVLVGDMSLVGPRPCMIDQKSLYGKNWPYYTAVRPGLTGLWQVSGRNNLDYQTRVKLDVEYVQTLSIRRDLFIFLRTIKVVLSGHGSK